LLIAIGGGKLKVIYSRQAEKFLSKMDEKTTLRLVVGIENLPDGDVVKLRGEKNTYRLRIGSFRVKFTQDCEQILIKEINTRGHIYKMGVIL
jgi:mRNA interferase RelE/StbE